MFETSPSKAGVPPIAVLCVLLISLGALALLRVGGEKGALERRHAEVAELVDFETFAAMRPEHREMLAHLARGVREAGAPVVAACWDQSPSDQATIDAFNATISLGLSLSGGDFQTTGRWSSTALSGGGLGQGDPTILTYSFVPDGTFVPSGVGEASGSSSLFSWLDGIYGSSAVWQQIVAEEFERWGALQGITYVFEPADDGAPLFGANGIPGVRGDLRISAKAIDGSSGVLAYNFFPSGGGDMVLDAGDGFFNNTGTDSRRLRNVLAHEHGHGMGLLHVCPQNGTKLMEPAANTNFLGPQIDDVGGAQRLYGDRFEHNDTAATAADLGTLPDGTVQFTNLSTDDDSDVDWYRVRAWGDRTLDLTLAPQGSTYLQGPQTSGCNTGTSYDALSVSNLSLQVRASDGTTVLATAASAPAGSAEAVSGLTLPLGDGEFLVRVTPDSTNGLQLYSLTLTLSTNGPAPFVIQFPNGVPTSVPANQATSVTVRAVPLAGAYVASSGTLWTSVDGAPYASSPLVPLGGDDFTATLPAASCDSRIDWYVTFESSAGAVYGAPALAPSTPNTTEVLAGTPTLLFADSFQADQGWTVVNGPGLTDGAWTRGIPVGGGDRGDPAVGFDPDGFCWLTDNVDGNSDVDGGATTLLSPEFDLQGEQGVTMSFAFWYDNDFGASPGEDSFKIELSPDGSNWVLVESYSFSPDQWVQRSVRVEDFIPLTSTVRIRFVADDLGAGSVVEAGVDAFRIEACESPLLGPCAAGIAGFDVGGPFDVLLVNGESGGELRLVENAVGTPFTVAMDPVPGSVGPAPFVIFGYIGVPGPGQEYLIDFLIGATCFVPCYAAPGAPGLFTLTDNLTAGDPLCPALLPSTPAPWSVTIPGIGDPFDITLQGVIAEGPFFRTTNAVVLRNAP